jgi:hypothetical protein
VIYPLSYLHYCTISITLSVAIRLHHLIHLSYRHISAGSFCKGSLIPSYIPLPAHIPRIGVLMRFTRRRSSSTSTASSSDSNIEHPTSASTDMSDFARSAQRPRYESPPVDGRCMLLDCPEEVLVKVFKFVDRQTYTKCLRVRIPTQRRACTDEIAM